MCTHFTPTGHLESKRSQIQQERHAKFHSNPNQDETGDSRALGCQIYLLHHLTAHTHKPEPEFPENLSNLQSATQMMISLLFLLYFYGFLLSADFLGYFSHIQA